MRARQPWLLVSASVALVLSLFWLGRVRLAPTPPDRARTAAARRNYDKYFGRGGPAAAPPTLQAVRQIPVASDVGHLRDCVITNGHLLAVEGSPARRLIAADLNGEPHLPVGARAWALPLADPHSIQHDLTDPATIWIYDFQAGDLASFALSGSIRERQRFTLPIGLFRPVWVGDRLVSNGLFAGELLRSFRRAGDALEQDNAWGQSPFPDVVPDIAIHLNRSSIAIDPGRRRLALAFLYTSRLHVIGIDGSAERAISGPEEIKVAYGTRTDPREGIERFIRTSHTRYGYVDVAADEGRIFALFSGRSRGQWKAEAYLADRLHVFSWSGELLGQWTLPDAVYRIAFDPASRILYGIRPAPTAAIVEFRSGALAGAQARARF